MKINLTNDYVRKTEQTSLLGKQEPGNNKSI